MPFILDYNSDGVACPRFQCDKCGATIADARGATLLWDTEPRQQIVIPSIVCDECDRIRDPELPFSMGFETALIFLLANCQMTEERIKEARKIAAALASITNVFLRNKTYD